MAQPPAPCRLELFCSAKGTFSSFFPGKKRSDCLALALALALPCETDAARRLASSGGKDEMQCELVPATALLFNNDRGMQLAACTKLSFSLSPSFTFFTNVASNCSEVYCVKVKVEWRRIYGEFRKGGNGTKSVFFLASSSQLAIGPDQESSP